MLATNDRVIKLWSIGETPRKYMKQKAGVDKSGKLVFPKLETVSEDIESTEKRKFLHCHDYNINSLCCSPDQETFISADPLRINMWNIENSQEAY